MLTLLVLPVCGATSRVTVLLLELPSVTLPWPVLCFTGVLAATVLGLFTIGIIPFPATAEAILPSPLSAVA